MKALQIIVALCLITALLPGTSAVTLNHKPIERPILWEPGEYYDFEFSLSDYNYDAAIEIEGDWAKYTLINEITSPGPGQKLFTVTIMPPKVPDTAEDHYVYIGGREVPPGDSQGVSAVISVRKQIAFKVLYPYKSIKASLTASDVNIGDPVHFQVYVLSECLPTLDYVSAVITVTDGEGNKIIELPTNSVSIPLGNSRHLTATMDTTGLNPATYHASAAITYDKNTTTVTDTFRVGTLKVDIINYSRTMEGGKISPFLVEVKSGWNDAIENVHAEVYIEGKSAVKTPTITLEPWELANLTGYFDGTAWEPTTYNSTILLHFGDGDSTIEKGTLTITKQKNAGGGWIANLGWMHLLVAGIVILIGLLLANILLITKRRDESKTKKKNK